MNKKIRHLGVYTLVAISLMSILAITSCNFSRSGLRSVTVENQLCHYSLEYPAYYDKEIWNDFDFDVPYSELALIAPEISEEIEVPDPSNDTIKTVTGHYSPAFISVVVADSKKYFGESYSSTDKLEGKLEDEAKWANYQLLERAPLTVSGIEGEMVAYLVDKLMPIPREDGQRLEYNRAVYFDYNGLIWIIEAGCDQEITEQVKADFEHIIATFKILE